MEDFELATDSDGKCNIDAMTILNSAGGTGGAICGTKSSYSYVAQVPPKGDNLGLNFVVQSPKYRWSVKISQISCKSVAPLPNLSNCGKSTTLDKRPFTRSNDQWSKYVNHKVIRRRKKSRPSIAKRVCEALDSAACDLVSMATKTSPIRGDRTVSNEVIDDTLETPKRVDTRFEFEPIGLVRKKLGTERFFPAYSTRDLFCKSKFRNNETPSFKIIDGREAPISAYPWIVSLQYQDQVLVLVSSMASVSN